MWQKIKCWLGWHEYKIKCNVYCEHPAEKCPYKDKQTCTNCSFYKVYTKECKHCRKIKK